MDNNTIIKNIKDQSHAYRLLLEVIMRDNDYYECLRKKYKKEKERFIYELENRYDRCNHISLWDFLDRLEEYYQKNDIEKELWEAIEYIEENMLWEGF